MAVFPFDEFVTHVVTSYDVQADSVLDLYIKIAKYLRDNPIVGESNIADIINKYLEDNPIEGDFYSPRNPPPYPVKSVNGLNGDIYVYSVYSSVGKIGLQVQNKNDYTPYPYFLLFRDKDGTSVRYSGLSIGENNLITNVYDENGILAYEYNTYSERNPPPYPVKSVNGKTGVVIGLYDESNPPPYPVTSVDGKTGDVKSYSTLGVRKVFGETGALLFIEDDGKIGGISGDGVPHYCYSDLVPPPQAEKGTTILTKVFTGLTADPEFNFLKSDEPLGFAVDRVIACIAYNDNKTIVLTDVNIDLSIPSYGTTCFRRGMGNENFINSGVTNVKVYYI